jgi:hypothetical protein
MSWVTCLNNVIPNQVGHVFMKNTHIAVTVHVHLKRLKLHTDRIRGVIYDDGGKVGQPRARTNTSELGNLDMNAVIAIGELVRPAFYCRSFVFICSVFFCVFRHCFFCFFIVAKYIFPALTKQILIRPTPVNIRGALERDHHSTERKEIF